ncbi:TonB-dependent receptor [Sphingobium sp.]|uniref:TonB-dependent receptor n=1 Tax=Sphingobium sp. TaxID=1912891 RepID=UPI0028BEE363|nr:TonB-dependent receptor [Sphingobium sp.]
MTKFLTGAAIALTAVSSQAHAQAAPPPDANSALEASPTASETSGGLGDIVVTAQRRKEKSQNVPIALTAFASKDIEQRRIGNIADLNNLAPSLRITNADAAANPKIFIRGVGLSDFNATSSSGVGMYVDGVYIGSLLAQMSGFYDLQQIEVLRGPQGTLFGRNTTGGAINITSKQPTFDRTADFSFDYGRFNQLSATAGIGGPLIDGLVAYRVAGTVTRDDGYTVNRDGGDRVNNANRYAGRLTLLITPDSETDITLSANRFWNRGGARQPKSRPLFPQSAAATGPDGLCAPAYYYSGQCTDAVGYAETDPNPFSINSNIEGKDRIDLWGVSGTVNRKLGNVELVSVTAYSKVKRNNLENTDASPLQMVEINYISAQKQFSQELRLQGTSGRATWVLGGFYEHEIVTTDNVTDLLRIYRPYFVSPANPSGASIPNFVAVFTNPTRQTTDSYAAFGQVDYQLTDKLVATAGLRYSADAKQFHYVRKAEGIVQFIVDDAKTFGDFSGRLGLRYQFDDNLNVYASFNRGYKSGGFFGGSADDPSQLAPYKNETVNAYEIGSKMDLFDRHLRINASAFYYDYRNIQAFSLVERNGLTVQVLDNAADSKIYGGELEITATPVRNLSLNGSIAYIHANYGTYISIGSDDYTGNRMPHAPRLSITGGIRYRIDLGRDSAITPRLDMSYRTKVYFDSTQRERLSDGNMFLLDGEIAYALPGGNVELGAWGKNLTNKVYFAGLGPIDSLGIDLLSYAPPRTYGAFLRFHF